MAADAQTMLSRSMVHVQEKQEDERNIIDINNPRKVGRALANRMHSSPIARRVV